MVAHLFQFALLCFTSLFTMVNPLGVVPVLIVMVIGVEFFFGGLKPIVHDMLTAP